MCSKKSYVDKQVMFRAACVETIKKLFVTDQTESVSGKYAKILTIESVSWTAMQSYHTCEVSAEEPASISPSETRLATTSASISPLDIGGGSVLAV